jgi:hypothetical protein
MRTDETFLIRTRDSHPAQIKRFIVNYLTNIQTRVTIGSLSGAYADRPRLQFVLSQNGTHSLATILKLA